MTKTDSQDGGEQNGLIRTTGPGMGRRRFLQAVGAAGATAAVAAGGPRVSNRLGAPTTAGTAEAVIPLGPAAVGAGIVATGWLFREISEFLDSDDPDEELTGELAELRVGELLTQREGQNASTMVDNRNLIEGAEHTGYAHAKRQVIEFVTLSDSPTESEAIDVGVEAAENHIARIEANLLRSWNETVQHIYSLYEFLDDANETSGGSVIGIDFASWENPDGEPTFSPSSGTTETHELIDGTEMTLECPGAQSPDGLNARYGIHFSGQDYYQDPYLTVNTAAHEAELVDEASWRALVDELDSVADSVIPGIETWTANNFEALESGELAIEDSISPIELAGMLPEDLDGAVGIADMIAMDHNFDLDHEARIQIQSSEGRENANLYGILSTTAVTALEVGDQINPQSTDNVWFIAADPSEFHGEWDWYAEMVTDGAISFNREPYDGAIYSVETDDGTVEVSADQFSETDGSWVYEADDLNSAEIEEVHFYSSVEESGSEFIRLQHTFEVIEIDGDDSGEAGPIVFEESGQTHTDENYNTSEDFDEENERWTDLLEQVEDELEDSGGGGWGGWPDFGDIGGSVVAGGALLLGFVFVVANVLGD